MLSTLRRASPSRHVMFERVIPTSTLQPLHLLYLLYLLSRIKWNHTIARVTRCDRTHLLLELMLSWLSPHSCGKVLLHLPPHHPIMSNQLSSSIRYGAGVYSVGPRYMHFRFSTALRTVTDW